jgi:DNA-binding NarL/FixJ family response regulator
MSIRILLADDHRIVHDSLKPLLDKRDDIEVIAVAENGRIAVKLTQDLKPDVVILDITMPDLNGIEATHQITSQCPKTKVIVLSMHTDRRYVTGALNAGASGYLTKSCSFDELVSAIQSVSANKKYLSPEISGIVIEESLSPSPTSDTSIFSILTTREREVLQLLVEGKTVRQIADNHLCLSIKTVHTHRQQIMEKLDIHSIAELTKLAIREGLISLES